jgi:hypothetical protein
MDTGRPSIWPARKTGRRGGSPSARRSSFSATARSMAARTSFSAPKKRSAGTRPSSPWWGRWKL